MALRPMGLSNASSNFVNSYMMGKQVQAERAEADKQNNIKSLMGGMLMGQSSPEQQQEFSQLAPQQFVNTQNYLSQQASAKAGAQDVMDKEQDVKDMTFLLSTDDYDVQTDYLNQRVKAITELNGDPSGTVSLINMEPAQRTNALKMLGKAAGIEAPAIPQPFEGNAMTAQMGNILLDPAKKGTPEYDLAVSYWTAPEIVNRPDGSSIMVKKTLPNSVIQANPGLAASIDSEADANIESESDSSGIPVDTSQQGLEITQLTEAPKPKITPEQKKYDEEFLGLMNMNDSLATFEDTLGELGVQLSLGPLNAVDTQTLKSSYSNAMLAVKEAAELGALTGDDMKIVEQNLPDPTTLGGAFKGKDAAMEGVKIALDVIRRKVKNLNSVSKTQGVSVKEFEKSLTPLNPEALNLYKNPPAGYSKEDIDRMFKEKFGRLPSKDELK